jgi:hypothetical protein
MHRIVRCGLQFCKRGCAGDLRTDPNLTYETAAKQPTIIIVVVLVFPKFFTTKFTLQQQRVVNSLCICVVKYGLDRSATKSGNCKKLP